MTEASPPLKFNLVAAMIADALRIEPDRIEPSALLVDDLGCDALDLQTIACELDEAFCIAIPDDHVARWATALDVARSVASLTVVEVA